MVLCDTLQDFFFLFERLCHKIKSSALGAVVQLGFPSGGAMGAHGHHFPAINATAA